MVSPVGFQQKQGLNICRFQVGMHRVRNKAGTMVDMGREMERLPRPDCRVRCWFPAQGDPRGKHPGWAANLDTNCTTERNERREHSGAPLVRTPGFHCQVLGFDHWSGN